MTSRPPTPGEGLPEVWFFTPGPTQLHPRVPADLAEALRDGLGSESHRSERFHAESRRTVGALRELLDIPADHRVLFVGSATEAMERIVAGSVARRSHHVVNGAFARRFFGVAGGLGKEPSSLEIADGEGVDLDGLEIDDDVELVAVTQNETSTGVALDPRGIARLGRRLDESLLAVDSVTASPTQPLDLSVVDACFFSVQKLFGLPSGLGVLIASPALVDRSLELRNRGVSIGGYMHLAALAAKADRHETVATPNTLAIRLLGTVAREYAERGLARIRSDAESGAARLTEAAGRAGWTPSVRNEADRSHTILVFEVPEGSGAVREALEARGFRVGTGYGARKATRVRIANFPVHPPDAVEALARAIEAI